VASPSGADAVSPLASTGLMVTLALIAAFVVALNWAWLSEPF
jgi:hypothetical protein